ncbi:hypothetical protein JTE90_006642 [Oedothorax gibbosus]|uniref:Secreted protein n=1 Tax=Oedothorax gibbosus TaxID=931172 RepID=A0AAV6TTL8_9ARAC|nr:hypothetical protein JTE90_006642 [Oedothorax gibbosus]
MKFFWKMCIIPIFSIHTTVIVRVYCTWLSRKICWFLKRLFGVNSNKSHGSKDDECSPNDETQAKVVD